MGMSDDTKGHLWGVAVVLVIILVGLTIVYALGAERVADSWCTSLGYDGGDWTYTDKTRCQTINIEELHPQSGLRGG